LKCFIKIQIFPIFEKPIGNRVYEKNIGEKISLDDRVSNFDINFLSEEFADSTFSPLCLFIEKSPTSLIEVFS